MLLDALTLGPGDASDACIVSTYIVGAKQNLALGVLYRYFQNPHYEHRYG